MKKQVELSITHNGKDVVAYPYSKKEHVQFENGMNIDEFVGQDIATPTITHDTTAIKVGVGDSDVSGSVVDGTVNMTIKGQTYQNILPEPTLRNKMIGKSMQRLNEGYDNIEVVDGVSKSAILSGQTLVNYFPEYTKTMAIGTGNWRTIFNGKINIPLTPNTSYLFINNSNVGKKIYVSVIGETTAEKNVIANLTTNITKFTTPNTTDNFPRMNVYLMEDNTSELTYDSFMVIPYQDGMENWDIPYFEGMQSVQMPVLQTYDGNIMRLSPPQHTTNGVTVEKINDVEFLFNQGSRQGIGGWKWNIPNGEAFTLSFHYEKVSGCENQCQVHVSCAGGIPDKFDLSEQFGDFEKTFYVRRTTPTLVEFKPVGEITSTKSVLKISNLKWYIGNKVYSDKTNILSTPEDVVLKGIGNVKDELNISTGEKVERIGEVVLDGSSDENWFLADEDGYTYKRFRTDCLREKMLYSGGNVCNIICDKVVCYPNSTWKDDREGIEQDNIYLSFRKNCETITEFKQYLSQNPITIQYALASPVVKTVDLSSSGNWEKIVLNGSENWSVASESSNNNAFFRGANTVPNNVKVNSNNLAQKVICDILTPFTQEQICNKPNDIYGISLGWNDSNLCVRHKDFPLTNEGLTQWKQYLQQNPVTVWYQTTTTQDNSIREMLSFANGHLQVSSEAENSLLPSVQYEIPTKNSYHMDLMKTNTLYTMKAKTVSGTFTIDGTSYNVNANGTFTSPSSMTDKLLVMSNKTNEEVMLLEGNVIDKTIPYFKGIKSAFEGEEEIEIVSIGKNLCSVREYIRENLPINAYGSTSRTIIDWNIPVKPKTTYRITYKREGVNSNLLYAPAVFVDSERKEFNENLAHSDVYGKTHNKTGFELIGKQGAESGQTFTTRASDKYLHLTTANSMRDIPDYETFTYHLKDIMIEEVANDSETNYEPHKSNITKIPLLHPLRSLPNGVCDELIIDRLNHKAKLIQRVGEQIYDGTNGQWLVEFQDNPIFNVYDERSAGKNKYGDNALVCNSFLPKGHNNKFNTETYVLTPTGRNHLKFWTDATLTMNQWQKWLSKNPVVVYYQLEAPIITEIDLEGYPYAYKDGHIFLNSDIAPTTQITYSINQAQQIESANENLQRHEKEISHLQKLIAQYIQVEYESTLLSLKI